jgi:phage gp29-like protein
MSQKITNRPQRKPDAGRGKSVRELVRIVNTWRDQWNPLRGLVAARAVQLIEAAEAGDYADLELTLRKVERRYPVLKALIARRLSAVEALDWDIRIMSPLPPGLTEKQARAQQKFLRARYDLVNNLPEAIGFLTLAEVRGFSVCQIHETEDGRLEFHWLPQWCFSREGQFGDWYWNERSQAGLGVGACAAVLGEDNRIGGGLPRDSFIIREVDTPLYEIALFAFLNWSLARKDHAAFVEIFGLPNCIVEMPPDIPPGREPEFREAAEKVAESISGAVPAGAKPHFPTATIRTNGPFAEFAEIQERDLVLAGTGGLLTMLTTPTGIGQGASAEHGEAFRTIARADARKISAVLQSDFDRVALARRFPGQPAGVYFELAAKDETDITAFVHQVNILRQAGFSVDKEEVEERTGYKIAGDQAIEAHEDRVLKRQIAYARWKKAFEAGETNEPAPDFDAAGAADAAPDDLKNRDDKEDGRWVTIDGRPVFIRKGQSVEAAIDKREEKNKDKAEAKDAPKPTDAPQPPEEPAKPMTLWEVMDLLKATQHPKLTDAEKEAAAIYQEERHFRIINQHLRADPDGPLPRMYQECIDNMKAACEKCELPQDIEIYRGASYRAFNLDAAAVNKMNIKLLEGRTLQDKGFVSCSIKEEMGAQFSRGVLVKIRGRKGQKALFTNGINPSYRVEAEMTLPPGSRFVVRKAKWGTVKQVKTLILELDYV